MRVRHIVIGQRVETGKLLRARELRRQMTAEEKLLWQHLRTNRLARFHFRRQQVIDGFIVDFYCHAAGVVVEVDGSVHAEQADYDAGRDEVLRLRGFRILRISNEEVRRDLEGVLARIVALCRDET